MVLDPKTSFSISTSSGVPIYRQIMDQIKIHIASGRLKENDFLPSVRQIAKELEVNPMTVSKAYSLLETAGRIETVRGQGMRVRSVEGAATPLQDRNEQITPLLKETIGKAKQISLNKEELIDTIRKLWEDQP